MLLAGDVGDLDSKQREYLQNILQLNEHMISLITGWVDMERLRHGRVVLQVEPCNIGMIARQVAGGTITVARSGDWPMVLADPIRLRQLIAHLYEVLGQATVRARVAGGMCVLTVHDSQIANNLQRAKLIDALKGSGPTDYLGLRIAGLLAEAHGGSLSIDPHATEGLKLHLRLPLAQQMSWLGESDE